MSQRVLALGLFFCALNLMAQDTELKLYRPFGDDKEHRKPRITKRVSGQCDLQSSLIKREDAWRCLAEGQVLDPCFTKANTKQMILLCPNSPWTDENIELILKAPISNEAHEPLDMSRTYPWAIELTHGERCQAEESLGVYDAMPIRYRCDKSHFLMGTIQRCNPVWSTLEKTEQGVSTVALKRAWF